MNDVLPNDLNVVLQTIIAVVSAAIVPLLTNWLTARNADAATKQVVALIVSFLVAVAAVALSGHFDLTNLAAGILLAIGAMRVTYEAVKHIIDPVQDTGLNLGAPKSGSSTPQG